MPLRSECHPPSPGRYDGFDFAAHPIAFIRPTFCCRRNALALPTIQHATSPVKMAVTNGACLTAVPSRVVVPAHLVSTVGWLSDWNPAPSGFQGGQRC